MRTPAEPVCITLPHAYIQGSDRVAVDGEYPDFLAPYAGAVGEATDKLKTALLPEEQPRS